MIISVWWEWVGDRNLLGDIKISFRKCRYRLGIKVTIVLISISKKVSPGGNQTLVAKQLVLPDSISYSHTSLSLYFKWRNTALKIYPYLFKFLIILLSFLDKEQPLQRHLRRFPFSFTDYDKIMRSNLKNGWELTQRKLSCLFIFQLLWTLNAKSPLASS